jgi:hypothetical protein
LPQNIARYFTNYINRKWKKSADAKALEDSNPFLKFAPKLTGRALYAEEQKSAVKAAAKTRMERTGETCPAAAYQTELASAWNALLDEEKEDFEMRADTSTHDTARCARFRIDWFLSSPSYPVIRWCSRRRWGTH